ncbi:MAG: ACP S-malonyltransferase [Pseudohongiellaceae bacterium]
MQKFGFVFPGQGSQKLGMLSQLAEHYPAIIETFNEASEIIGIDIWDTSQRDTHNSLDQTQVTQPVLLTASIAIWRLWVQEGGPRPSVLAGHSLGEYSALVCAGVLQFRDAVQLVQKRGQFMQAAVPAGAGAMAAIVGLEDYKIHEICESVAGNDVVAAANFNSPGQIVIAGHKAAVERAMEACKKAGAKRTLPLNVSVPSHCALMKPAAEQLAREFDTVIFSPATVPVVQNVCAEIVVNPELIKENLVRQLFNPVLWVDSIKLIHASGISKLIECGPGKVLCGLIKRINSDLAAFGLDDNQSFQQAKDEVSM